LRHKKQFYVAQTCFLRHNRQMPKIIPKTELDAIVEIVRGFSGPVSIEAISANKDIEDLSRRTLQRRLASLVESGRLVGISERGGRRYHVPEAKDELAKEKKPATYREIIPLSQESEEIRAIIARPLSSRKPVGYQTEFLDTYQPNESSYLSTEIRQKLSEMGQAGQPEQPAGTYVRKVLDRLLIDLSWNSSRLEGNTYSLLETQRLLEFGESAEGKAAEETQMILNHKAAIEMLVDQAEDVGFNRFTICNLHALLSDNLLPDPSACGRIRSKPVGITGTIFHPLEVPQVIEEQFHKILDKAGAIEDAFEQAFFTMVHLPYLQPFEDVNKRVSRLAANIPLIKGNLCPLSFIDVSQQTYIDGLIGVYELKRVEYLRDVFVWAYERSCARYSAVRQSLGDPDPFRLKYRTQVGEFVAEVVRSKMDKREAAGWIAEKAAEVVPAEDKARFIEVVETELTGLHEGNIARYRLKLSEFKDWNQGWQ
jgi:hypothetical protein